MARISFWLASSHWRGWQLSSEDNQHPRGTAPCDQAPWPRRCHSGATWELLVQFTSSSGKNSPATANTRPSSMSSLFLTELPPTPLCAHLLVFTFGTTARYYTHVSELSS